MSGSIHDIERENARISAVIQDENERISGYKFSEDSIANQLAFVFGGEKGEAAAKKIIKEAKEKFPNDLQFKERRKFIEEQVQKKSRDIDTGFQQGLRDACKQLVDQKKSGCSGEDAQKQMMFGLMKSLGLNVDEDNVQTHYNPGPPPPAVMAIYWVNRPTENLKNEDSQVNQLADMYKSTLDNNSQQQFEQDWQQHRQDALQGGPKIDKEEFLERTEKRFNQKLTQIRGQVQPEDDVELSAQGSQINKPEGNRLNNSF